MHQHTYSHITSSDLVELSLAQFDYMHCVESGSAPQSGFEPWHQDVKLVCYQCSSHSAKLDNQYYCTQFANIFHILILSCIWEYLFEPEPSIVNLNKVMTDIQGTRIKGPLKGGFPALLA